MSKSYPYYVRVDENVLFNNTDLDRLVESEGWAGFGIYIGFLTLFRKYESKNFMIPYEDLPIIGKNTFHLTQKKFEKVLTKLKEIGWLCDYGTSEGRYIYSPTKQKELISWKENTKVFSESGKKGMAKRYGKLNKGEEE